MVIEAVTSICFGDIKNWKLPVFHMTVKEESTSYLKHINSLKQLYGLIYSKSRVFTGK